MDMQRSMNNLMLCMQIILVHTQYIITSRSYIEFGVAWYSESMLGTNLHAVPRELRIILVVYQLLMINNNLPCK